VTGKPRSLFPADDRDALAQLFVGVPAVELTAVDGDTFEPGRFRRACVADAIEAAVAAPMSSPCSEAKLLVAPAAIDSDVAGADIWRDVVYVRGLEALAPREFTFRAGTSRGRFSCLGGVRPANGRAGRRPPSSGGRRIGTPRGSRGHDSRSTRVGHRPDAQGAHHLGRFTLVCRHRQAVSTVAGEKVVGPREKISGRTQPVPSALRHIMARTDAKSASGHAKAVGGQRRVGNLGVLAVESDACLERLKEIGSATAAAFMAVPVLAAARRVDGD
jgi:hypothetical protein